VCKASHATPGRSWGLCVTSSDEDDSGPWVIIRLSMCPMCGQPIKLSPWMRKVKRKSEYVSLALQLSKLYSSQSKSSVHHAQVALNSTGQLPGQNQADCVSMSNCSQLFIKCSRRKKGRNACVCRKLPDISPSPLFLRFLSNFILTSNVIAVLLALFFKCLSSFVILFR
jgi:hypothetical protein